MSTLKYSSIENLSFLSVTGVDSKKFLQGQSSCQFNDFELGQCKLGSFSDAKGRVFSNFKAIAIENGFLLQMSADIIENCLTTLKKYAAFFKVALKDERETYQSIALSGDFSNIDAIADFADKQIVQTDSVLWVFHSASFVELWVKDNDPLLDELKSESIEVKEMHLNHSIEQGIAWVTHENLGEFVAQMLNLELIGAIDFKKGCYTGQEIIARLHYKGVSKKRVQRVEVDHKLIAGEAVFNQSSKVIGRVVNSSSTQALISANINESYFLKDKLESSLKLLDLPYQI